MKFLTYITEGKWPFLDKHRIASYSKDYTGPMSVELKKPKKQRSLPQNDYYWGYVIPPIAEATGYEEHEHDEVHEGLKHLFLCTNTGPLPRILSTADLDTVAFETFLSAVRAWASKELKIYIPLPNEPVLELFKP